MNDKQEWDRGNVRIAYLCVGAALVVVTAIMVANLTDSKTCSYSFELSGSPRLLVEGNPLLETKAPNPAADGYLMRPERLVNQSPQILTNATLTRIDAGLDGLTLKSSVEVYCRELTLLNLIRAWFEAERETRNR